MCEKEKINRQSDLNIGTAGHVDHGKCIARNTPILIPGKGLIEIRELWNTVVNEGEAFRLSEEEWVYPLEDLHVLSLNLHTLVFVKSNALLYVQKYDGKLYKIVTGGGRWIELTSRHPLPLYKNNRLVWTKAKSLKVGDLLIVPSLYRDGFLEDVSDNGGLSLDEIKHISKVRYNDYIFDLVVPKHHNFIGGEKGFILHNTTIIEALTGIWTSSHSEELRRGITIRIGYADMPIYKLKNDVGKEIYWSFPKYNGYKNPELLRIISFVDCPGHESLMANMLSGAAVMDGAMLVIAANESVPRPQTKEHTMALQIMGVKHIVVVQNKLDLVSKEEAKNNYRMIRDFLSSTMYADSPIIPISAVHNVNLHYLVEALYKNIPVPRRDFTRPYRIFIIRSFDINKPGTPYDKLRGGVIGGSIVQGKIKIGDEIEILPGYLYMENNKVKHLPLYTEALSLRTAYASLKEAYGGGLIGVQTDLDPYLTKSDGLVGNIAGKPDTLPPVTYELNMDIELFRYVVGTDESIEVKPIEMNEKLRLNVGPAITLGIVSSVSRDSIHTNLYRPVVAEEGWRVAIATRVNNMWRLIGVGVIK